MKIFVIKAESKECTCDDNKVCGNCLSCDWPEIEGDDSEDRGNNIVIDELGSAS